MILPILQTTPQLAFTRTIDLPAAATATQKAYEGLQLFENKSADDYAKLITAIDEATNKYPLPTGMWSDRKISALVFSKRYAEADQTIRDSIKRYKAAEYGWIANSTDPKFQEYISRPEWSKLYSETLAAQAKFGENLSWRAVGIDPHRNISRVLSARMRGSSAMFDQLSNWNDFQKPSRTGAWVMSTYRFKTQSGVNTVIPYLVYIPKSYRATKPNPLLMYVYGGWIGATYSRSWTIGEYQSNNPLYAPTNFLDKEGMIEVFPMPNRDVRPDTNDGVECLNGILAETKATLNIDDDRCFMMGHSDGGTASYEMLRTNPSSFAAFVPLNGWPGFRFNFRNFALRPLFSYSGENDTLYPATSFSGFLKRASSLAPNWDATLVKTAGHELTFSGTTIIPLALNQIRPITRNSFRKSLQIEGYPGQLTRCDWLQISEVDPAAPKAPWHDEISFMAKTKQDEEPQKMVANPDHGMLKATIEGNTITVQTSRVAKGKIWLHPSLVDLSKPIRLIVNGELKSEEVFKVEPEKVSREFLTRFDRKALWVGSLSF